MTARAQRVRTNMQTYRSRLRAQGLRPVQLWVPDTRSAEVIAEWRRQSLVLAGDPAEQEIMEWIEEITDTEGWS